MIVEHLPQMKTKQEIPGDVYTYISPKVPHGPSGCGRPHYVGEEAASPVGVGVWGQIPTSTPHNTSTAHALAQRPGGRLHAGHHRVGPQYPPTQASPEALTTAPSPTRTLGRTPTQPHPQSSRQTIPRMAQCVTHGCPPWQHARRRSAPPIPRPTPHSCSTWRLRAKNRHKGPCAGAGHPQRGCGGGGADWGVEE